VNIFADFAKVLTVPVDYLAGPSRKRPCTLIPYPDFDTGIQVICGFLVRFLVYPIPYTPDAFFT
jgi:hypothetical protein